MVIAEWQRAWRALYAAEILTREGYYEDAVSRAYYATLHARASFSSEDTHQECQRTREFLDRIHRYLLAKGLTHNALGTEAGNA